MSLRQSFRRYVRKLYPKTVILLYHRVAECRLDPQRLCVTPQHFTEQMACLQEKFHLYRLSELRWSNVQSGIVITFDDGYSDNLHYAAPILTHHDIPATVFVSSGQVASSQPFWWDTIAAILLGYHPLPSQLTMTLPEFQYVHVTATGEQRQQAYNELLGIMQKMSMSEISGILSELFNWAGISETALEIGRALTVDELMQLAQQSFIEIGAHTCNHVNLAQQTWEVQCHEIQSGREQLENWLNRPITSFAYPFGFPGIHYTEETVRAVHQAGFLRACANQEGWVTWRSDPFQYPRYLVRDWNGDEFMARLSAWLAA